MMLNIVVLPQPLGPTMLMNSDSLTSKVMSLITSTSLPCSSSKVFLTLFNEKAICASASAKSLSRVSMCSPGLASDSQSSRRGISN
ncbi:hypothetical protein D3C85_1459370 [compost metagenome]